MKMILSSTKIQQMTRFSILLLVIALIVALEGCAAAPTEYDLSVSSTAGGAVTEPGEGTFTYSEGRVVILRAEAEHGYRFVNWIGSVDQISDVNATTTTITMNAHCAVIATFEATPVVRYNLAISGATGGSVTTPGEGVFTYDEGTVVGLVAVPDPGYRFLSWTGDVDAIANPVSAETTITVDDNYAISASFEAGYAIQNTLIEGLSDPAIRTKDEQGQIWFDEFDPVTGECRLSSLNPVTGEAVKIVEHQGAYIQSLSLDEEGNLYYVLKPHVDPPVAQIRRLPAGETESQVLFSIIELDRSLLSLAVDRSGNVYFVLQEGVGHPFDPGSELRRIPAGTTTAESLLVLEDSLELSNIQVAESPSIIYFKSLTEEVDRIYRFDLESKILATVLERTTQGFGYIGYLATEADGELYYLYRQRSDRADPVQSSYLEIGRFTREALETGQPPELLVADELDRAVNVWGVGLTLGCFAVGDTGEVFFSVLLTEGDPHRQTLSGIFWFDPLTGACVTIVERPIDEVGLLTFALDSQGNVYYAAYLAGTIARINR